MASGGIAMSLLFIDAYDSFSQNIVALLKQELNADVTLIKIDTNIQQDFNKTLEDYVRGFEAIVVGPGPGNPNDHKDVGLLYDLFDAAACWKIPILGICLGFQVLCVKYGLHVARMREPCHGQTKKIVYYQADSTSDQGLDIFDGLELDNIWATCYNSLGLTLSNAASTPNHSRPTSSGTDSSCTTLLSSPSVGTSDSSFRILAIDQEDNVMAIKHQILPFWGVQFHPESCKSNQACRQIVKNWSNLAMAYRSRSGLLYEENELTRDIAIAKMDKPTATKLETRPSCMLRHVDSAAIDAIRRRLLQMSVSTGNTVHWQKLRADFSRAQVSELINDMSQSGNIAMLESTKKGRFSIYAVLFTDVLRERADQTHHHTWQLQYQHSMLSIKAKDSDNEFHISARREEVWAGIESLLTAKRATEGSSEIPFWGGFIGYLSYEHGLDALEVRSRGADRSIPDISLAWVERSIVHDNLTNTVYVQSIRRDDEEFVNTMTSLLSAPSISWARTHKQRLRHRLILKHTLRAADTTLPDHEIYTSRFHSCQSQLRAGNSYELCLTTEATIEIPKPPSANPSTKHQSYSFALYQNLHAHNPVPFGAYLRLAPLTILSTSPEQYISWSRDGIIDMIPMKGTVKRSPSMTLAKATTILSSAKETAENLMIADLIRHDLYSALGSDSHVEVIKLCEVIEHETVYQLVSHIRAHAPIPSTLTPDERQVRAIHYGLKALRQTVPPGSMTGAPKKRSCEILADLERRNRGVYSGVLGYMDVGGGGNWSVCIRTAFRHDDEGKDEHGRDDRDVWHLGAGGAITVLSDAEGEWQEMSVKLDSVLRGFKEVAGDERV